MDFFAPLGAAFIISFLATALVIRFAHNLGIVDDPACRPHPARLHTLPIPRGGGIPILAAILVCSLLFLETQIQIIALVAASSLLVGIGILDDRKDISPLVRLGAQITAALIIAVSGINITYITNPFGGIFNFPQWETLGVPIIAWGATIAWLVFITNTISWSSGVDGQLAGFVPIAAATIAALSLRFAEDQTQIPVIILSLIVSGAYLGFLPFSVYPQRIMPGFSGGQMAGFLLGVLAILAVSKMATAIIVLGIPMMDAVFTIARRVATGTSPLRGDQGHLHHRLLAVGWSKRTISIFYSATATILGLVALQLNSQAKFYTILMLGVLVGALIVWLTFGQSLKQQDRHIG